MESTLHRQLKGRYGPESGGRSEVAIGGFRVDAVTAEGRFVEVQMAPLRLLKAKLAGWLPIHEVAVVRPVILATRVVRRASPNGPDLGARRSPRRGSLLDVFEELIGLADHFPHPRLTIEVVGVDVDEVRVPRRRRPGYSVVDRALRGVLEAVSLRNPEDLWSLLPVEPDGPFTSEDLASLMGRPIDWGRKVAYCLHRAGAARMVGKRGNRRVYATCTPVEVA